MQKETKKWNEKKIRTDIITFFEGKRPAIPDFETEVEYENAITIFNEQLKGMEQSKLIIDDSGYEQGYIEVSLGKYIETWDENLQEYEMDFSTGKPLAYDEGCHRYTDEDLIPAIQCSTCDMFVCKHEAYAITGLKCKECIHCVDVPKDLQSTQEQEEDD